MSRYAQQLSALQRAIIERQSDDVLVLIKSAQADARVAIYADGYVTRLYNAVRGDYSALQHYLGGEVFETMLQHFVQHTPSHHWDLNLYSQKFSAFVARQSNDVLAQDIAAIESAIAVTYWSKSCEPLAADALQHLSPDALAEMMFTPRLASCLLILHSNANDYLTAFRAGGTLPEPSYAPNYLLVLRARYDVRRYGLDPLEHQLLWRLFAGMAFGHALEEVAALPACDVPQLLAQLPTFCARWMEWALWRR